MALAQGDYTHAEIYSDESLVHFRDLGHRGGVGQALRLSSRVAWKRGELVKSSLLIVEGMCLYREMGYKIGIVSCLSGLSILAEARDHLDQAVRLFAATKALAKAIDSPLRPLERTELDQAVASARSKLRGNRFSELAAEGRSMSMEEAIKLALEEEDGT